MVLVRFSAKKRDFPTMNDQGRENCKEQASAPNPDAHKNNYFYALRSRRYEEDSPNVLTGMLQQFSIIFMI